MHVRIWLASAAMHGLALSAVLTRGDTSAEDLDGSSMRLRARRNVSSVGTGGSDLKDGSEMNLVSLTNATGYSSNSTSLYGLPSAISQCNGGTYGRDLNRHSCFDAWRNLGLDTERVSWGPRGSALKFQYPLPARWSSDDGQCAIQVQQSQPDKVDFASLYEINQAAERVMEKCIDPPGQNRGGYSRQVGREGGLEVAVMKYSPNVKCGARYEGSELPSPCLGTLRELQASHQPMRFGYKESPDSHWPLPWTFPPSGPGCAVTVILKTPARQETMRWYDIWAAAVAIDAMCVRFRRLGIATGLGAHGVGCVGIKGGPSSLLAPLAVAEE